MGQRMQSFAKFAQASPNVGADVLMSNHPGQDDAPDSFDVLDHRGSGGNPFVIGRVA